MGTENEVRKRRDSGKILAWKTRQISVGQIWCCEVFSLARNVVLLLICTFLKLNNKSLSLVGFPHIGVFPGICLNFCVLWVAVHCVFPLHILLSNVYFCLWKFLNVGFMHF
jgi:hypothetical protein